MSQPGPDPGAARSPPSWLVFEDDVPWLMLGAGFELSDISRNNQLGWRLWTPRTDDIVNDKQLEQRYKAAGIEHLFFVWAVTDPGERQRCRITRYGVRCGGRAEARRSPALPGP
jgi:hypothetical protein